MGGAGRLSDGSIALVDEAGSEVRLFSADVRAVERVTPYGNPLRLAAHGCNTTFTASLRR